MKYVLIVLGIALAVSACDNPTSNDVVLAHSQAVTGPALPDASYYFPGNDDLSPEERRQQVRDMSEGLAAVEDAFYGAGDAREADQRLTGALADAQGVIRMVIQQLGSITMLERYPGDATSSDDQWEIAAKHTRQLAESGSPEVEVIADALDHLGDRIPSTERARLAEAAVASARRDEKPDDADRQTLPGAEARRQVVRRLEQVVAAGGAVSS